MTSPTDVWVTDGSGAIGQWNGTAWQRLNTDRYSHNDSLAVSAADGVVHTLVGMRVNAGSTVCYAGLGCGLFRFDATSQAWASEGSLWAGTNDPYVYAFHAGSANATVVAGDEGRLALFNGTTFMDVGGGPSTTIYSAWLKDTGTVWVSSNGTLYRLANGGWSTQGTGTVLAGTSNSDVWALDQARVRHWNGQGWTDHQLPSQFDATALAALSSDIWVVGRGGAIARLSR